ncbi:MAG: spermidine/putrescine ABC transporter substrate-binding protein [Desulfuromonadaceae bacterium]|nr:spermidine/putrescine ABC transporter substrate-binding protein [Desulfuromonadaceae bacterium]
MKKSLLVVMLLLSVFARASFAEDKELRIFTWSEYMDERKFSADFQAATGIKVKIDVYENNEDMLAKLQAGGVNQYDIIVPSDYIMSTLLAQKLIQPLDHSKIPNLKNIMPQFRDTPYDPGSKYTAPWQWGTVGLMYNKQKVSAEAVKSWGALFDLNKQAGTFWLMDSVRDSMAMALMYLGYDMNSRNPQEIKKAAELLIATKNSKNCRGFKPGVGGKNDVDAGAAAMAIVYNGDAMRSVMADPKRLGYTIPKEGGEIWVDLMAIPAHAPHVEAAHKWINWILEPKRGAMLSNYNRYATPNQASLPYIIAKDKKMDEIYPGPETMKRLHYSKDLGSANRMMDEAWTKIKSH